MYYEINLGNNLNSCSLFLLEGTVYHFLAFGFHLAFNFFASSFLSKGTIIYILFIIIKYPYFRAMSLGFRPLIQQCIVSIYLFSFTLPSTSAFSLYRWCNNQPYKEPMSTNKWLSLYHSII